MAAPKLLPFPQELPEVFFSINYTPQTPLLVYGEILTPNFPSLIPISVIVFNHVQKISSVATVLSIAQFLTASKSRQTCLVEKSGYGSPSSPGRS